MFINQKLIKHIAHGRVKKASSTKQINKLIPRTILQPLSAKSTKWSNTLKQFVGKLSTNCLSVFDHLVGLAFKGVNLLTAVVKIRRRAFRT